MEKTRGKFGESARIQAVPFPVELPLQHQLSKMARPTSNGLVQAMQSLRLSSHRSVIPSLRSPVRGYATETTQDTPVQSDPATELPIQAAPAAPEIDFSTNFIRSPARIVPASPSYFSGNPRFVDHVLNLESLQARYAALPILPAGEAPRMAWFKLKQFREYVGEQVPVKKYKSLVKILQRLNRIQPDMVPGEVRSVLDSFLRPGNPYAQTREPPELDENGRARAKGKRKESKAVVHLVEGEGEVLVNGKSIVEAFPRVHDRESALWALRSTQRMDKYNAWVTVRGGGVTGQTEAVTLAIARALMVHEPGLKPVLRRGKFRLFLFRCSNCNDCLYWRDADLSFFSWCYYCRCSSCGEKETGSCQGSQDARLGQTVKPGLSQCFSPAILFCIIYLMYYFTSMACVASSVLYPIFNAYGAFRYKDEYWYSTSS